MGQTNLRRLLAYASLSHVGLVLLGIASLSEPGSRGRCSSSSTSPWSRAGSFC